MYFFRNPDEFIVRESLLIKNSRHNFKLNLKTKREQVCSLRFSSFSKNLEKDTIFSLSKFLERESELASKGEFKEGEGLLIKSSDITLNSSGFQQEHSSPFGSCSLKKSVFPKNSGKKNLPL